MFAAILIDLFIECVCACVCGCVLVVSGGPTCGLCNALRDSNAMQVQCHLIQESMFRCDLPGCLLYVYACDVVCGAYSARLMRHRSSQIKHV